MTEKIQSKFFSVKDLVLQEIIIWYKKLHNKVTKCINILVGFASFLLPKQLSMYLHLPFSITTIKSPTQKHESRMFPKSCTYSLLTEFF